MGRLTRRLTGYSSGSDDGGGIGNYKEFYIPAAAMVPADAGGAEPGTLVTATYKKNRDYLAYDGGATEEEADFSWNMPDDWDGGPIKARVPWTGASGSSSGDTVEWGVKAGATKDNGAIDADYGTPQVVSDTLLANDGSDHQDSGATPAITVGGSAVAGDFVDFKLYRNTDGSDNMAEDAYAFGLWIQYKRSSDPAAW